MQSITLGPPKADLFRIVLAKLILMSYGWNNHINLPHENKTIVVFAPHTTNWDFVYMVAAFYAAGIKPQVMIKSQYFWGPSKWLFLWLGCIPIDRKISENTVESSVRVLAETEQAFLAIAPEATRKKAKYWRSGFYHIAKLAKVPIYFSYLDYEKKIASLQPGLNPTGDIELDMSKIREHYQDVKGKYPDKTGEIKFKDRT